MLAAIFSSEKKSIREKKYLERYEDLCNSRPEKFVEERTAHMYEQLKEQKVRRWDARMCLFC